MIRERDPDVDHDERVQREVDERWEICNACEPWFSNAVFAELASIIDAFIDGQRSGVGQVSAGANPWDVHTEHYAAWERGRNGAELNRLNRSRRVA